MLARSHRVGWQPDPNSSYVNTIAPETKGVFPGDLATEERIGAVMRWNALVMVVRANKAYGELGGHIASYASAADLFEVGFNHFFHARSPTHGGDLVFFQPHSAPGVYARAFLEGRLQETDLLHYRQEITGAACGARGLSSFVRAAGRRQGDEHYDGLRAFARQPAQGPATRPTHRAHRRRRGTHLRHGLPVQAGRHLQQRRPTVCARGFLLGATFGRTTLVGKGLQHQDGTSHLVAATIPNCKAYDPAPACELAVIPDAGMRAMLVEQHDVFYYITLMNENYAQPSLLKAQPAACCAAPTDLLPSHLTQRKPIEVEKGSRCPVRAQS